MLWKNGNVEQDEGPHEVGVAGSRQHQMGRGGHMEKGRVNKVMKETGIWPSGCWDRGRGISSVVFSLPSVCQPWGYLQTCLPSSSFWPFRLHPFPFWFSLLLPSPSFPLPGLSWSQQGSQHDEWGKRDVRVPGGEGWSQRGSGCPRSAASHLGF